MYHSDHLFWFLLDSTSQILPPAPLTLTPRTPPHPPHPTPPQILQHILASPIPDAVDSAAIAGILELLRAKGLWGAAARLGYVYGALRGGGSRGLAAMMRSGELLGGGQLERLGDLFESEWAGLLEEMGGVSGDVESSGMASMDEAAARHWLEPRLNSRVLAAIDKVPKKQRATHGKNTKSLTHAFPYVTPPFSREVTPDAFSQSQVSLTSHLAHMSHAHSPRLLPGVCFSRDRTPPNTVSSLS